MPTLNWIGKEKVINHHMDVPYRVLEKKYSYGVDSQTTEDDHSENMVIHGDNLEALKSLMPRYEGKIRCIYIDPPYNTGNENWIYNDNVNDPKMKKWLGEVVGKEGEDLSRHDKWLCMMYPRLRLLQKLLAEDGAIFISIDNSESANLKLMCDEIFGCTNYVDTISWFKKASPSNDAKYFSNDIEYILIYAKKKDAWQPNRLPLTEKQLKYYQNPDNDERGEWNSATYTCNKSNKERPNLYYPIQNPFTGELVFPSPTAVWKYSKEQTEIYQAEGRLFWGKDGSAKYPRYKKFLFEHDGVVNRTLWHYDDVNHTQGASSELKELGIIGFSTPKPSQLIQRIIQIATDRDSIVLDSFAGSGTTAHAVLSMNKSDNGNRKFFLIDMEEYADSITAERVKRVIDGYGDDKKKTEGTGGSFSYYELGERLLLENGNLNPSASQDKIREYIWYMETRTAYRTNEHSDTKYYLSQYNGTAYYFYYEKEQVTNLDNDFLAEIKTKASRYVIYADSCSISDEKMQKYNITFKKIPRDIVRL